MNLSARLVSGHPEHVEDDGRAEAAKMTVDDALELLRIAADWTCGPDYDDPDAIRQAYRHGARHLHPDTGGDPEQFRRLVEARDLALGSR